MNRVPTSAIVAALLVPVLVLGGFALISGVAIAVVLVRTVGWLRWWAAGLAAIYAVAVTLWLTGPSDAPSLTKYLSPVATALFAAAGAVVAVAHLVARRRAVSEPDAA